jgi:antitoxin component YwqK of YwqJK toxin-antitoxin module
MRWYRNGQKKDNSNYENGRITNLEVWKPNGERCPHTKIVDGNGVWVRYEEDGSEAWRSDYRNGLFILKK